MRKAWYLTAILLIIVLIILSLSSCSHGTTLYGVPSPEFKLNDVVGTIWDEELMMGANKRIEQCRKGDATILITGASGKPVEARVTIEMLKHDFLFGCNLLNLNQCNSSQLNKDYADAFLKLFNYGTLPFFWDGYEPQPGNTLEETLLASASWAKNHGITTQGHPLIWAMSVPSWVNQSPDEMGEVQKSRVSDIVKEFCGLIDYWDVMNEPTMASSQDNPLGRWIKMRTPEVVTRDALDWAGTNCPEARLIVNDYNTSNDYLSILQEVIKQGGHISAVGIQSHMHTGVWRFNYIWDICNRFSQLGIPLQFTEVTVLSGATANAPNSTDPDRAWKTTPEGEALQASYVPALYTLLFSNPSVEAITWWDLSDLNAWQGAPAGLLRDDMSPKPAYDRLLKLIHGDWWTRESISSNSDGTAKWRGFYGLYSITVEFENKKVTTEVHLAKGADNVFRVRLP